MPTTVPKEPAVAALHDVWASLDALLAGLDDADWSRPTCLPGWNVKAVVAHIIGTESMLLGDAAPDVEIDGRAHPHVRNDIGRVQRGVGRGDGAEPPAEVLARFRAASAAAHRGARRRSTHEEWDAVGFTPAGQDTYGRFMRIRVFDWWLHELDIRDAVGRPGGEDGPAAERRPRRDRRRSWATSSARRPARRRGRGCASS